MYGDWYAKRMYIEGCPQNLYHIRHYGHPSKFGYKDLCKLWKAENFDTDALLALFLLRGFVFGSQHVEIVGRDRLGIRRRRSWRVSRRHIRLSPR